MSSVHFYLKKSPGPLPLALVFLQFKYNGRRLVYSFGEKINPADWSRETQRVKTNRQTILDGRYALNEVLDRLERHCLKVYKEESEKGIPAPSTIRFRLDVFLRGQDGGKKGPGFFDLLTRFAAGEIRPGGKEMSRNTLKNYSTSLGHLQAFDAKTKYHIRFDNINLDFLGRYILFLKKELKLKPNSIARDIGAIKTVMNAAIDLGYTTPIQYRHKQFHQPAEETDAVQLSEKEIARLYRQNFSHEKRLEPIRDLFVLSCLTGIRFYPLEHREPFFRSIVKELIIKEIEGSHYLLRIPAAAGPPLHLPCPPIVQDMVQKYKSSPDSSLRIPSIQKFNDYIKEACRMAGLTEKGRLSSSPRLELWQCISYRTALISMAAHYYRSGHPLHELMRMTGHQTEKSFFRFARIHPPNTDPHDNAK